MATKLLKRPKLSLREKVYLPAIVKGLKITLGHAKRTFLQINRKEEKFTMEYPEEKWDSHLPDYYRGAPTLVTDEHGRERCVSCQLCEFICPPRAITITPGEIPAEDKFAKVEKA